MRTAALLSDEKHNIRYKQELEWSKLLDFATDEFFYWNIIIQLKRNETALGLAYSGLILRFQPISVATATAKATVVS